MNSVVKELKEAEVGVDCRALRIPALLFADDMVLFAEEEEMMGKGLEVLEKWCEEWDVKVNVDKCGLMHLRRKRVKQSKATFAL